MVITYGLLAMALITFATFFVHDVKIIILLRSLKGFSAATFAPVALVFTYEIFHSHKKRGVTIAAISTGFLFAGIIGQVASFSITIAFGWNFVFLFFLFVYMLLFILSIKILPKRAGTSSSLKYLLFTDKLPSPYF